MLNRLLLISAIILTAYSCSQVRGSGVMGEEVRRVEAFSEIELNGAYTLEVTMGEGAGDGLELILSGDDNLLELVETSVSGKRLTVESDKNLAPDNPLVVKVSPMALSMLEINGSAKVQVTGLSEDEFTLDIAGSAKATLAGRANTFNMEIAGSGEVHAKDLKCPKVIVDIAGSADAEVCATEELEIDIAGSGDVKHYCNATSVKQDIAGSGTVEKK